jgi:hypothetical protein
MDGTLTDKDSVRNLMKWRRPILGVLIAMVSGCGFAQIACSARTPEQALPSEPVAATNEAISDSSASFYRLARIVVDPELHRRWALIANCTHPERPLEILALSPEQRIMSLPVGEPAAPAEPPLTTAQHNAQPAIVQVRATSSSPVVQARMAPDSVQPSTPVLSATVPLIRAGDLVRLWSSDGNVRLEMAVVSLEYGHVGQIIHLRRMGQTTLLAGVVVDKDSAELIP